jgi:hypothetical protein
MKIKEEKSAILTLDIEEIEVLNKTIDIINEFDSILQHDCEISNPRFFDAMETISDIIDCSNRNVYNYFRH